MAAINARCAASGQTIAEGDACRVVLISQSASFEPIELETPDGTRLTQVGLANTSVYPNCNWRPETAFLRAVYDDYGMVQLTLKTPLARTLAVNALETVRTNALRTVKGKNPYHDLGFDLPAFIEEHAPGLHALLAPRTWMSAPLVLPDASLDEELQRCWSHVLDLVRRHRVFVHGHCRQVRPLALHVVHEEAYQGLALHLDALKNWEGETLELGAYLRRALDTARKTAAERQAEAAAADAEAAARMGGWYLTDAFRSAMDRLDVERCFSPDNVARRILDRAVDMLHEGRITDEAFLERAYTLSRDRSVICAMERYELKFTPVTYVNGDVRNTVGSAWATFVAEVSGLVTAQRASRD